MGNSFAGYAAPGTNQGEAIPVVRDSLPTEPASSVEHYNDAQLQGMNAEQVHGSTTGLASSRVRETELRTECREARRQI